MPFNIEGLIIKWNSVQEVVVAEESNPLSNKTPLLMIKIKPQLRSCLPPSEIVVLKLLPINSSLQVHNKNSKITKRPAI
jgi:hypothetical protein